MAFNTNIGWTNHTYNIAWGCTKVSKACTECYAEAWAHRCGFSVWGPTSPRRVFDEAHWCEPLKWNDIAKEAGVRHKVFCSSMCDVFEEHPTIDVERAKLWPLIRRTPHLDWQLLTKRAHRVASQLPSDWSDGYENVWIGVSIENNEHVSRANHIRNIPAVVRFVSYEPALGPLDELDLTGIDWVIYGGESGPKFRQDDSSWAEQMKAKCETAGVAFFHKQNAGRFPGRGASMDGRIVNVFPKPRTISSNFYDTFKDTGA
jgi:protein gp37